MCVTVCDCGFNFHFGRIFLVGISKGACNHVYKKSSKFIGWTKSWNEHFGRHLHSIWDKSLIKINGCFIWTLLARKPFQQYIFMDFNAHFSFHQMNIMNLKIGRTEKNDKIFRTSLGHVLFNSVNYKLWWHLSWSVIPAGYWVAHDLFKMRFNSKYKMCARTYEVLNDLQLKEGYAQFYGRKTKTGKYR